MSRDFRPLRDDERSKLCSIVEHDGCVRRAAFAYDTRGPSVTYRCAVHAFWQRVRDARMSTLVGPAGLADRVVATLRAAQDVNGPFRYTVADLCHHERGRLIVTGWDVAADVARDDYQDRLARAERRGNVMVVPPAEHPTVPPLGVFDLRQRILWPEVARALYHADLAAREGALCWCAVMTPTADHCLLEGEHEGWPNWRSRATDLSEALETAVLLAELP